MEDLICLLATVRTLKVHFEDVTVHLHYLSDMKIAYFVVDYILWNLLLVKCV